MILSSSINTAIIVTLVLDSPGPCVVHFNFYTVAC